LARLIYGIRISLIFGLVLTFFSSVLVWKYAYEKDFLLTFGYYFNSWFGL
jgi:ABC-type microcin C transport system permease subunit YejE